jgi:hypothetical protein
MRRIEKMKKIISILLLICTLSLCLVSCGHEHEWNDWKIENPATVLNDGLEYRTCECGERETRILSKIGAENVLSGKWIWKAYPNNPVYMYLSFSGQNVRYGMNMLGSDVESGTWNCTYKVERTTLTLTTEDGTDFIFSIQDLGSTLKVFDDDGHEYIREN